MRPSGPLGEIITFYSYKGGTGRTLALANLAWLLAQDPSGTPVLMIDWDLEAPGLHRYFRDLLRARFPSDAAGRELDSHPGLIDAFAEIARTVQAQPAAATEASARAAVAGLAWERYFLETDSPGLFLLKAGNFGEGYATAVRHFDWEALHERSPWLFRAFAEELARRFRYVLIDSRTGLTDTSGICTSIMPDKLVLVFTPNRQSLLGALYAADLAARYRKNSDDLRPLALFPLPSRIEAAEPGLRELWRLGNGTPDIPGYQPAFEALCRTVYDLPECDLGGYFSEVQVQHVPRYAYGEDIAVREESGDRLSLTRSFECFLDRLRWSQAPWEAPRRDPALRRPPAPVRDEPWIREQQALTQAALRKVSAGGFFEASFFPAPALGPLPQQRLFRAAAVAQVPGLGWPIGAVVASSAESRPRPTPAGIAAEVADRSTRSYDYWTLRADGSFYFVRNLEEDPEYLLADDRIDRVVELLLYCKRLYSFLQAPPGTRVLLSLLYSGLRGRALGCRTPGQPEALQRLAGSAAEDEVRAEVVLDPAGMESQIVRLVKQLTAPLFVAFYFYELPEGEYRRLVTGRLREWGYARGAAP